MLFANACLQEGTSHPELGGGAHSGTIVALIIFLGAVYHAGDSTAFRYLGQAPVQLPLAQVAALGGIGHKRVIGELVCFYYDVLDAEAAGELARPGDHVHRVQGGAGGDCDEHVSERFQANREEQRAVDSA